MLREVLLPELASNELKSNELLSNELPYSGLPYNDQSAWQAERLRLLWEHRRLLARSTALGLAASALLALLIPRSYTSTTQLMPPDTQSNSSLAMMASMAAKNTGGLGAMAADLLGSNTTGALFMGILRSDTAESRLVEQFDLKKVYGERLEQDARADLDQRTSVSEDRKSGIISISVTDRSPERAAGLAKAYVDQLNSLIAQLSISSAHRERLFLEERLKAAKRDLDDASNDLAEYSSQNSTLDVQTMGKAALDAAGRVAGELLAAESQLQGLRQVYSDNNSRVRALDGRVAELRKQLETLDGTKANETDANGNSAYGIGSAPAPPRLSHSSGLMAALPDGRSRDRHANDLPPNDPVANEVQTSDMAVNDMPYPSLRNLPRLGVKYADYYRRAKIQETVYELLTEQYELTKIQEVKETPSVKVLDRPKVAERKSSPPRMMIVLLGAFLSFSACLTWVVGLEHWQAVDPQDPRKLLIQEVAEQVTAGWQARTRRFSRNGSKRGR